MNCSQPFGYLVFNRNGDVCLVVHKKGELVFFLNLILHFFNYEHKVATCILVYKSGNNRTSAFLILWRSKGELGFNNTGNLFYLGFETDWSGWAVWREKQVDIFHCCCLCRETANWWKNSHLVRQWIYFDTWQKSYFLSFPGATQGGIRKAAGEY